jgi:hypothetical protein
MVFISSILQSNFTSMNPITHFWILTRMTHLKTRALVWALLAGNIKSPGWSYRYRPSLQPKACHKNTILQMVLCIAVHGKQACQCCLLGGAGSDSNWHELLIPIYWRQEFTPKNFKALPHIAKGFLLSGVHGQSWHSATRSCSLK